MTPEPSASEDFIFLCPTRLDCVLAAAEVSELAELREWCEQLPERSYGQVFVAGDPAEHDEHCGHLEPLPVPPGVAVNWVAPTARGSAPEVALAAAVDAWLDEWVRVEYGAERHVKVWAGARAIPAMRDFWHRLEAELSAA